ncbi:MAG: methylated-DNA--[protein]-cysteine S-methyltransferase [Gemmataceae bacterium]|nr:methylated-DNA--[protein]-cysteine S-methyltransferase [Gemmataceae bacterium]
MVTLPTRLHYARLSWEVGTLLFAASAHGLAVVSFAQNLQDFLRCHPRKWRSIVWREDALGLRDYREALRKWLVTLEGELPFPLDMRGSDFQKEVWRALQTIPRGSVRTYGQVAREIGQPSAVRAVAQACAANPLALVIPCHRVVRSDGSLGGYRWGQRRKRLILQHESQL